MFFLKRQTQRRNTFYNLKQKKTVRHPVKSLKGSWGLGNLLTHATTKHAQPKAAAKNGPHLGSGYGKGRERWELHPHGWWKRWAVRGSKKAAFLEPSTEGRGDSSGATTWALLLLERDPAECEEGPTVSWGRVQELPALRSVPAGMLSTLCGHGCFPVPFPRLKEKKQRLLWAVSSPWLNTLILEKKRY